MGLSKQIDKTFSSVNKGFNKFVGNIDLMVATILGLVLLLVFRDRIAREFTNLCVFVLTAIILQMIMHDTVISFLGAFLVTTLFNVWQQENREGMTVIETFKQENDKVKALVDKLKDDTDKNGDKNDNVSDDDITELLKEELGDDDSEEAQKRRERLKAERMTPSEAQRELFKLVDVGAQLQKQMEQMVPGLKKAGTVMKMLKGMKNV